MILKSFILLTYVSTIMADTSTTANLDNIAQNCYMNAGLGPDLTDDQIASRMECIFSCMMKSLGTMSDEGVYQAERIIQELPKDLPNHDKVVSALRTCTISGATECKTALLVRDCLHSNLPCSDFWACTRDAEKFMYFNPILNPL